MFLKTSNQRQHVYVVNILFGTPHIFIYLVKAHHAYKTTTESNEKMNIREKWINIIRNKAEAEV